MLDGGIINNVPLFSGSPRQQVVLTLSKVNYPAMSSFTTADPCIEALILRGALEARRFIDGALL